jgi:hypothetical protein
MKKQASYTQVVESGPKEPSAAEVSRQQAQILERLHGLTADQLTDFQGRSLDADRVSEIGDVAWSKVIWRK